MNRIRAWARTHPAAVSLALAAGLAAGAATVEAVIVSRQLGVTAGWFMFTGFLFGLARGCRSR